MKEGATGSALILSIAAFRVATTSVLAGLLKPMWLSLIWTKLKSPCAAAAAPASERRVGGEGGRPPPLGTAEGSLPRPAPHLKKTPPAAPAVVALAPNAR